MWQERKNRFFSASNSVSGSDGAGLLRVCQPIGELPISFHLRPTSYVPIPWTLSNSSDSTWPIPSDESMVSYRNLVPFDLTGKVSNALEVSATRKRKRFMRETETEPRPKFG